MNLVKRVLQSDLTSLRRRPTHRWIAWVSIDDANELVHDLEAWRSLLRVEGVMRLKVGFMVNGEVF